MIDYWKAEAETAENTLGETENKLSKAQADEREYIKTIAQLQVKIEHLTADNGALQTGIEELIQALHDRDETAKEDLNTIDRLHAELGQLLASNERMTNELRVHQLLEDVPQKAPARARRKKAGVQ